jgi:tRNA-specific 2-thiouridylase
MKGKRVIVAMSGGVDSSVAAALLKEQGYDVVGITFQLYDYSRQNRSGGKGGCCSLEDVTDARLVCQRLGIKHYLVDSRERFQKRVVDYFSQSYKQGRTPNPCVACNTFIKFDELEFYADSVNADFFATGHYVRMKEEDGIYYLQAARDLQKDQSYFLMGVSQQKLSKAMFPLGEFTKDEIRAMAERYQLEVSQKPDSMEVCFVPNNDYRSFLKNEAGLSDEPGNFVDSSGVVLGQHPGLHHFTIGQRKGLAAYGFHDHYVVRMNPATRDVVLGKASDIFAQGLVFEATELHGAVEGDEVNVKIRSRAPMVKAKMIQEGEKTFRLQFDEPQRAVTPGQFAVIYRDDRVLGGGPILRAVA